jgi:predicted dehydrogenase
MQKEIGLGMLGYGFMGRTHSYAWKVFPLYSDSETRVRFVSICGRTEDKVKKAAKVYGYESYCKDWKEIVRNKQVDIVDNCLHDPEHPEPSIEAFESGKNVLCEKPLAPDLKQARRMLSAAEKSGMKHGIQFNYRFLPAIQYAKKMIQEGAIGKLYDFRGWFNWLAPPEWIGVYGPALPILAIHWLDMARFLMGEVKSVCGVTKNFAGGKGEDVGKMLTKFENGAVGTIEGTWYMENKFGWMIQGSEAALAFDSDRLNMLKVLRMKEVKNEEYEGWRDIFVNTFYPPWLAPKHPVGWVHGQVESINDFLECVVKDRDRSPSFYDGVKAQEILEATYISSKEERWVSLPLP